MEIVQKSKTLIILSPGFPRDENDTACLPFLQNFVRELNAQVPHLHLIIMAFDYPFTARSYQWNRNEVLSFNGWEKRNIRKLLKWLFIWQRLKKIKRNNDIIGVLSLWCGECAFLGNRFAKRNGLRHFCWIQGQDAKNENKYPSRIKPGAAELIAISDFNQKEFGMNHGLLPQHVIPAGISPAEADGVNSKKDIDILGVGSLIPLKQYHLFVEVIRYLKEFRPDIRVVLCGKGPEEGKIRMLIEKYDLEKNITLTLGLPHAEILKMMSRSRVFLHPSNYEGFSVACLEALSLGCHVISFVKPMEREIDNWQVVLTKEEMAEAALSLLRNTDTEYKPVFPFTMKETVKKILQLYE